MIRFACPHCGAKFKVPDAHAGKKGRCPHCKTEVAVPAAPLPERPTAPDTPPGAVITPPKSLDQQLLDLPQPPPTNRQSPEERAHELEVTARLGFTAPPIYTGQRRFVWPLDVLLYPISEGGLTALAIVAGIPFLLTAAQRLPFIGASVSAFQLVAGLLTGLYAGWYFAECAWDSARGGTRAPSGLNMDSLRDMWDRVLNLYGVYLLFIGPVGFYRLFFSTRLDLPFWPLAAWAVVFFPMGLLAMLMLNGTEALNPLFLLGSILRVFLPYVTLVLLLAGLLGLVWLLPHGPADRPSLWSVALQAMGGGYGALILAHIFGRFYWRYRERLDWGV